MSTSSLGLHGSYTYDMYMYSIASTKVVWCVYLVGVGIGGGGGMAHGKSDYILEWAHLPCTQLATRGWFNNKMSSK